MTTLHPAEPDVADAVVGPALARRLTLPLVILFGLGVTIGAGIYVLIGVAAGRAGMHAPWAFVFAALVMAPTAASFAELSCRMPFSAGEAAYVEAGFRARWLTRGVGLMVAFVGVTSAAAIARGSAGYLRELVLLPYATLLVAVILAMGAVALWGIIESVIIAAAMTLIEIAGLLVIVVCGFATLPDITTRLPETVTGLASAAALTGILGASLLAFFAFIGFESLANIAEEVKAPERTLPRAIAWTLVLSTVLYVLVVWVALVAVSREELATAPAPLSVVYTRVTGASPLLISAIAVVATINGIIAQMVMSSRVIYGLADRGHLPPALARINATTRTPVLATILVVALVMAMALTIPIEALALTTSRITLAIFVLVNSALVVLKRREANPPTGFSVPILIPTIGAMLCFGLLIASLAT